jgi:hypothetical protein
VIDEEGAMTYRGYYGQQLRKILQVLLTGDSNLITEDLLIALIALRRVMVRKELW